MISAPYEIEVNQGYKLIGSMRDMPKKLCFVSGRQGFDITVLLVNEIVTAKIMTLSSEFAQIKTKDGIYNLMTINKIERNNLDEVAEVCNIIRNSPYEN